MTPKKSIFLLLCLLLTGLIFSQTPTVQEGYLDLEGYRLNEPLSLEGEWMFYPDVLSPLPWTEGEAVLEQVPSQWDDVMGHHFGAGTYHIKINPGQNKNLAALRITENIQAFTIFLNGRELYSTGQVSSNSDGSRPGINGRPILIPLNEGEFDLTIMVSNWDHRQSGLNKPMYLGLERIINYSYYRKASIDIFTMGIAFSFAFLYMAFFLKRTENKVTLWFSLLCLALGLRTGLTGTSQLENFLGEGWTLINKKVEYLTFLAAVILFVHYVESLLEKFKIRWFSWVIPIPVYFYALVIIFTPMTVYSFLLPFFQYYTLIFVLYMFYFLYRSWKEPENASHRLVWECLFLMATLIYDVLFYNNILTIGPVAGYSLFAVIFLEGIFQARILSDVINRLEILTEKYRKSIEEINQGRMEIEQQNKQLNWLSLYDQLTGLPNRYNLTEVLKIAISRAERNKSKIAVIYMDVDNFKDINDTMGHNRGDELLRFLSDRLKGTIRKTDSLFRMGGDEFALIYSDLTEKAQLNGIIEKLRKTLTQPLLIKGETINITLSMGAAFYPDDGRNLDILIKNAELAMYQAKNHGKDHFISYTDNINNDLLSRISLNNQMKRALDAGHYQLYYQAQINSMTDELFGFEALIRWIDPEKGLIPPDRFIPVAEENGFIAQIGRWTLEESCRQIVLWRSKGYKDFTISVNISAYQFGLDHFIFDFREILEKSGVDPAYLKVELTETMLMANPHLAQRKMQQLQEMGINIALDDFGTGYSSLSYLNIFPVDYLKIDRAFIRNVHRDEQNRKLTTSIINLGKNMDLTLIAEGVESQEEKHFVREQGCHIIQGFVYSKPVPPEQAESFFPSRIP